MNRSRKLFSIGMAKNNADVIESHVRYNLNIFDEMIILDNGSTDNTLEILKLLKNEGLPIHILEDTDREFEQGIKTNQLLLKAVNEFDADVVVPLDVDEFLISARKGNPRKILKKIEPNTFYQAKWRTYIPDFSKNNNEKFIPAKITMARDENLEGFCKVILPKELVKDYNAEFTLGNHDLNYDPKYDKIIKRIVHPDLRIAHFPIRSKEQTISKAVIGWIYTLYRPGKGIADNFHFKVMFDELKEKEDLENKDLTNFAKYYSLRNDIRAMKKYKICGPTTKIYPDIKVEEDPIDLTFCKDIEIKYTPDKIKPISEILESFEWLAKDSSNYRRELLAEEKTLKSNVHKNENTTSLKITETFHEIGDPIVSVVIPSYNHEKYVEETIESILNQTYQDFEVIITDDGSSDNTVEKIKKFSDPRIKLFVFEENKGACKALNNCIIKSKGKYIAYISSDDIWEPEKLEKQVKFLDENPQIAAVFTKVKIIDESSNLLQNKNHFYYAFFDRENRRNEEWLRTFFFQGNCLSHPSAMIRKSVYHEVGLYNEAMANLPDFDMWVRICLKHNIHILDEKLIKFRMREGNANASSGTPKTHIRSTFEWKQVFDHYLEVDDINFFLRIFPDAKKYGPVQKTLIPYFLGRLNYDTNINFKQLWGLETIYNLLQSTEIADMLGKKYNFKYSDFIKMSADADVFNLFNLPKKEKLPQEGSIKEKGDVINPMEINKYNELNSQLNDVTTRIYEIGYLNNNNRSIRQRLISTFPRLYILFKRNNKGFKGFLINIKGYNAIKKHKLFDMGYYLVNYPDVRRSGADPLLHYIYKGFNEGHRPNPTFDGDYYLKKHKDVERLNMNPLVHYSLYGMKEGRKTISPNYVEEMEAKENLKSLTSPKTVLNPSNLQKTVITGGINIFSDEPVIFGWLAKNGDITPRTAILKIDDNVFEIICDSYRSDLKEGNINEGNHAFDFIVPIDFVDGKTHNVKLIDKLSGEIIAKREIKWIIENVNENRKKQLEIELNNEKKKLKSLDSRIRSLEDENSKMLTLMTCNDLKKTDSLKLNIGCGSVKFQGWINIDIEPGADLVVDLRNGLPLMDNSTDFIYNEHFIEHLTYIDAEKAVKEFYRVLKKGGVLRIATPELDYIIEKYVTNWEDQDWVSWSDFSFIKTKGQMLNIAMREWGHEYLYNDEDLRNLLKKAGFKKITKQELKKSEHPDLVNRETREDSKLILEAEK